MKTKIFAYALICALCLCGCKSNDSPKAATVNSRQNVSDVIEDLAAKQEEESLTETEPQEAENTSQPESETPASDSSVRLMQWEGDVDIDLTGMNANMIYSEVYNMMAEPDNYIGKTIRIYGEYVHHYEESTDRHYYACVVRDALACCASGLEFALVDDYVWPDDYPEDGSEVVVTGDFNVYMEGYFKVMVLENAIIEKCTPKVS